MQVIFTGTYAQYWALFNEIQRSCFYIFWCITYRNEE